MSYQVLQKIRETRRKPYQVLQWIFRENGVVSGTTAESPGEMGVYQVLQESGGDGGIR